MIGLDGVTPPPAPAAGYRTGPEYIGNSAEVKKSAIAAQFEG